MQKHKFYVTLLLGGLNTQPFIGISNETDKKLKM